MGYEPGTNEAPLWADLVALIPITLTFLIPCIGAVIFGGQANETGDHRGRFPRAIGAIAGAALLILTVVSEVENVLQR